jgi:cell division protein FtsN
MPTDYKSRGSGRDKKSLPGFAWFLAGLTIGLFVALLAYLDGQPESSTGFGDAIKKELEKIKNKSETLDKKTADKSADKKEPKFNFYTILPELEVLIPDAETRPPSNKSTNNFKDDKQYVLQAGSFRSLGDAKKLKASLALLGYEASIQHVSVNREEWHRVRIGPYENKTEVYKNINLLHQHNISAMPMELKP